MSSLAYSLLPNWALRMLRKRRQNAAKLRVNVRDFKLHDLLKKGD